MSDQSPYVADASVWINLAATGRAYDIVQAIGRPLLITQTAFDELDRGRSKGRQTADEVMALVHLGAVRVVDVPASHDDMFYNLVAGSASETLDDGEAATLAYAASMQITAVIDERKATAIAAKRMPRLPLISTVDLLLDPNVKASLGQEILVGLIVNALQLARMRVSESRMGDVVTLIGAENVLGCPSLPSSVRAKFTV